MILSNFIRLHIYSLAIAYAHIKKFFLEYFSMCKLLFTWSSTRYRYRFKSSVYFITEALHSANCSSCVLNLGGCRPCIPSAILSFRVNAKPCYYYRIFTYNRTFVYVEGISSRRNVKERQRYLVEPGISKMSDTLHHIYRYHISGNLVDLSLLGVLHGDVCR